MRKVQIEHPGDIGARNPEGIDASNQIVRRAVLRGCMKNSFPGATAEMDS